MEYSGLAILVDDELSQSNSAKGRRSKALATRQVQRTASKARRAQEGEILRLEGNALFINGDYLKAADLYYQAVMEVHGPKPILMANLAAAYLKLEAYDETEWAATVALEYDPHYIKARFRRGVARKEIGAFEAAAKDFETLLHHDPHNVEAKEQLEFVRAVLEFNEGCGLSDEDDEYPGCDESPWGSYSDSDTPDCRHKGVKNIPCRFYNHDGCKQGMACQYSHAPDEKSVRDELGRNVCTHFLLNNCTYGGKCVYSHDRTHLPRSGWWNYPEQVASAIKLQPLLNKGLLADNFNGILREHPEAKNFAARLKRLDVRENLFFIHRAVRDAEESVAQSVKPTPTEEFILLISLEEEFFTSIHAHFLSALEGKAKVAKAFTVHQALQDIDSPNLIAVLLTDAGVARPKHKALVTRLVQYTKNGGIVVAGGSFSSFVKPQEFRDFTKAWDLSWTFGSYHRTTFSLNPSNDIVKRNPSLSPTYSMKALHASGILPEHAIYKSTEDSYLQSLVWAPVKIEDKGEAPAVQAKVDQGWFGFIGDVNAEVESTKTTLAMLGLLDQAGGTLQSRSGLEKNKANPPSKAKATRKVGVKKNVGKVGSSNKLPQDGAERP